jgi:iron complex transport system permease protein
MSQRLCLSYSLSFALLGISIALALSFGSTPWPLAWQGLLDRFFGQSIEWNAILDERLPRMIVTLSSGASLAVAGVVMQALFHNPLASPSVLGISSGGSLAVIIVLIFGWHIYYPFAIALAAFLGCLTTLLLVYAISMRGGIVHTTTLIVTGIALSTALTAIRSSITYAMKNSWELILVINEWDAGSTFDLTWDHVHLQLPFLIAGLFGSFYYRHELNLLTLGEEDAESLGVNVKKLRWRLFICVALLTAGSLAAVGTIGFFGLILPHMVRYICGPDNAIVIPLSALGGASLLLMLDMILRIMRWHSMSLGNVTAVLGAIFFLILICQSVFKPDSNTV